jgi:dihydroxy-acid dehydratase
MDAVVLIGGCDKTIPAQLMAAASCNIPAIVLPVGPMLVGHYAGQELGACTDCRRLWGEHRGGRINEREIEAINERLAPTAGTCMVMGTASTMACIVEALGIGLPYSAAVPATHADRLRIAESSGTYAAQMAVSGSPKPSELITPASIKNALVVMQAIGGSTNGLIHLTAIAGRMGIKIDLESFNKMGQDVPVLVDLKPSGDHFMEHFHWAGGVPRLMHELKDHLDLSAKTVTNQTLQQYMECAEFVPNQTVIRSVDNPITAYGSMAILGGNLAPRGAVIKQSAASKALMQHTGRAVVFENVEDMTNRIDREDLDVHKDDVLVLRNAGPIGAPGMPEAGYLPIPKKLAVQGVKDMVRISDARMSGTAFGTIVLHIAPESAIGGPLGLIQNGDLIKLDVHARRIDVLISDEEMTARQANFKPNEFAAPVPDRGYAALFHRCVTQADEGCDFDFLMPANRNKESS